MYHDILVAVDGDPNGRDAIALARQLAEPDANLTLAHVYGGEHDPARGSRTESAARGSRTESAVRHAESTELLERERSEAGIDAGLRSIGAPSVGRGLHHLALSRPTDLIVSGSSGQGPAGRVLLGDHIRGALGGAPCAVAIAPRGYAHDRGEIDRIGVAYDFSEAADAVVVGARRLASECAATLSALYVAPFPVVADEEDAPPDFEELVEAERAENEARADLLEDLDGRVTYGQAGRRLTAFGDDVDLLVAGSRARGPMRSLSFGSTSNYLASHAGCALLIFPRAAQASPGRPSTASRRFLYASSSVTS
jgi:nucleotide-binding universal stress UspA family protein